MQPASWVSVTGLPAALVPASTPLSEWHYMLFVRQGQVKNALPRVAHLSPVFGEGWGIKVLDAFCRKPDFDFSVLHINDRVPRPFAEQRAGFPFTVPEQNHPSQAGTRQRRFCLTGIEKAALRPAKRRKKISSSLPKAHVKKRSAGAKSNCLHRQGGAGLQAGFWLSIWVS